MNDAALSELRRIATAFRGAIERSRAENATAQLPYFPEGACRMVSVLFALHLRKRGGVDQVRFISGHVPGCDAQVRHTWLAVDDAVVDLTADPFGEEPVVIGAPTRFHDSLDQREERESSDVIDALREQEVGRCRRQLAAIEERMPDGTSPAA